MVSIRPQGGLFLSFHLRGDSIQGLAEVSRLRVARAESLYTSAQLRDCCKPDFARHRANVHDVFP